MTRSNNPEYQPNINLALGLQTPNLEVPAHLRLTVPTAPPLLVPGELPIRVARPNESLPPLNSSSQKPEFRPVIEKPPPRRRLPVETPPVLRGNELIIGVTVPFDDVGRNGAQVNIRVLYSVPSHELPSKVERLASITKKVRATSKSGIQEFTIKLEDPDKGFTHIFVSVVNRKTQQVVTQFVPFSSVRAELSSPWSFAAV